MKITLTKFEREHADEIIKAIHAGYDWNKSKLCWAVTCRGVCIAEVGTRLSAVKIALENYQAEQK